jgi:hypothetical protein
MFMSSNIHSGKEALTGFNVTPLWAVRMRGLPKKATVVLPERGTDGTKRSEE